MYQFYIKYMNNTKITPPIHLDEDDYDFIKEYKEVGLIKSFQEFIRDAVREKRSKIETIQQLRSLEQLKK